MTRRVFLQCFGAASVAVWPFGAWAVLPERTLIWIELKGANDGLNTLIPFSDPLYAKARGSLAIAADSALRLDERTGMHPALEPMMALWQSGSLAWVQGVGYERPNLSHFRSIEIWDTASRSDQYLSDGWMARLFGGRFAEASAEGVVLGSADEGALLGARAVSLKNPEQLSRVASRIAVAPLRGKNPAHTHVLGVQADLIHAAKGIVAPVSVPGAWVGAFGEAMKTAVGLILAGNRVPVIKVSLSGFDTHVNQAPVHARLLGELAAGVHQAAKALQAGGAWGRVVMASYSEFGRRVAPNGSNGTDHGTAAPHFVTGGAVRGGLYGAPPRLDALEGGNLRFGVDLRAYYAELARGIWGIDPSAALSGRFERLGVVRG